jgi:hypothetical protein
MVLVDLSLPPDYHLPAVYLFLLHPAGHQDVKSPGPRQGPTDFSPRGLKTPFLFMKGGNGTIRRQLENRACQLT